MAKNYTPEYQLCQWEETDVVSRVEFNQDNSRVEAGMVGLGDKITAAKTQFSVDMETMNTKVETVESKVNTVGTEVDEVETKVGSVETKVGTVETKVGTVETKVGTVETQVTSLQTTQSTLESKLSSMETTISQLTTQLAALEAGAYNSSNFPFQFKTYAGIGTVNQSFTLPCQIKFAFCWECGTYALGERSGTYIFNQKVGTSSQITGNPNTWCTETTTNGVSVITMSSTLNILAKTYVIMYVAAD